MKANLKHYRPVTILIVLLLFAAGAGASHDQEARKTLTREFAADRNTQLEMSNRYGKIEIKTWDKPLVKMTSTVIVKASSKSKAEDRLNQIQTDMAKSGNNIRAVTTIAENNSSWWSGWWGGGSGTTMEINYEVYMPADVPSIIENKYGNIYLQDLSGKTSLNLKYGNLYAGDINNDFLLEIGYGKATVGETKNLSGTLSYSDYIGKKAGMVILTTKYSKVQLDEMAGITANSKYDTYKLGTAGSVTMTGSYDDVSFTSLQKGKFTAKYTNLSLGSVGQSLEADIDYGSLQVENLKAGFTNMKVNTDYAPVKIRGAVPCRVEISGKYFDADLGQDFIVKDKVSEGSSKRISGYKMSQRAAATITIETRYGDVTIK